MKDQKRIAKEHHQVESPFGRIRRLPALAGSDIGSAHAKEALRMAINFPIQSGASDITVLSLISFASLFPERDMGARMVLTVHDSIYFEVPESEFGETLLVVKETMESHSLPWMLDIPITVDIKTGPNCLEMEKVEF